MKRKLTLIFLAIFISIGFWQLLETAIYSQDKPLTIEQVKRSLNISNDKEKESAFTVEKVRQVGVSFPLTPEIEIELRRAGATDELIEAIRQNSPPLPTPISTTPKPSPKSVSTPTISSSDILDAYSRKEYNQAIFLADTRLSANPNDSQTLSILAQSYFMKDDFDSFAESAIKAIEAGGRLEFSLTHHHAFYLNSLHRVTLVLTEQAISFLPQNEELPPNSICPNQMFTVDLNQLVSAELVGNLSNEIYLKLTFTKSTNSKKTVTIRFADRESYFVKGKKTKGIISYIGEIMVSRKQALGAMTAITSILNIAKTNTAKPTPTSVKSPTPKPETSPTPAKSPAPQTNPTDSNKKPTSEKQVTSDKKQDTN